MVNISTRFETVYIDFSSSRHAALIERKLLQCTTLSKKHHHCSLSDLRRQVFTFSGVFACVSIYCMDQKQHSNPDFLTKSINISMQR